MKIKWNELSSRERDALVAEHVMHWAPYMKNDGSRLEGYFYTGYSTPPSLPSNFTTDMKYAWEVAERFECFQLTKYADGKYKAAISFSHWYVISDSMAESICICALRIIGAEVDTGEPIDSPFAP